MGRDSKYCNKNTISIENLRKKVNEKIEVIKDVVEDTAVKVKKVTANNKSSVPRY